MSRSTLWVSVVAAALFGASLFTPFDAHARHFRILPGLMGEQDARSKELLALSPADANQVAAHDLLSVLKPTGAFTADLSHNVEGMTFLTQPYQTNYADVCRKDRVTLRYRTAAQPEGVDAQPMYHIWRLPVPGFLPGASYPVCDARNVDASAAWFAAPSDTDAARAANMFRMAEEEVRNGHLTPGPCDPHGTGTCAQWALSLDDPSKIQSVERCGASRESEVCYLISFDQADITIEATLSTNTPGQITPSAITSMRIDEVDTVID
ncbi:MAG: hypothetical protein ABUL73_03675 [Alphaproteobacteria bacterium]